MNINVQFNSLDEMVEFAKQLAPLNGASTIFAPTAKAKEPAAAPSPAKPVNSPAKKEEPQKTVETPAAKPKHSAADVRTFLFELNKAATGDAPRTVNKAKDVIHALGFNSFKDVPEEKYDDLYAKTEEAMKALKEADHAG